MQGLIMAGQLILSLAILVTLHEWGHFIAARSFGIKVEKFYLFFDAWKIKLFSFKKGDTEYGIGWLPLGGYVKIAGMIDESMDTDQMKKPAESWEFRSKPAWQRLIVMIGGVTVNLILGMFIFWMYIWILGEKYIPKSEMKYGIVAHPAAEEIGMKSGDMIVALNDADYNSFNDLTTPDAIYGVNTVYTIKRGDSVFKVTVPKDITEKIIDSKKGFFSVRHTFSVGDEKEIEDRAKNAGLMIGDRFVKLNDTAVPYFDEFQDMVKRNKNKELKAEILRNGETKQLTLMVDESGTIGFAAKPDYKENTKEYGFLPALKRGVTFSFEVLYDNIRGLGKVFRGEVNASKSVAGPIGIATMFGPTWEWERFWKLTATISLILAFMNMLPIPALDGGHVIILLVEMIIRRPLPERAQVVLQTIGMVILLGLMALIMGNDIYKAIMRAFGS